MPGQCSACTPCRPAPASPGSASCVGNDAQLNGLRRWDRSGSRCQTRGLMPIANCTASSSRSRAGGQRPKPDRTRPHFRPSAPPLPWPLLPATLNQDLPITLSTPSRLSRRIQLLLARCCRPHAADLFRSDAYADLNQISVTPVTLASRPANAPSISGSTQPVARVVTRSRSSPVFIRHQRRNASLMTVGLLSGTSPGDDSTSQMISPIATVIRRRLAGR